ncbi:MAG: patatin-like phospholipase family protein [Burkholderiaceae bacterium]
MKIDWTSNGKTTGIKRRHDHIAYVLQGGGALGAYQAGVYEELFSTPYQPDWVAGVSIGAINAALIVGNPPEKRVERLVEFWNLVSSGMLLLDETLSMAPWLKAGADMTESRSTFNQLSAWQAALLGIPGFYQPRVPPPAFQPDGSAAALSVYDTEPLRATLERLIDFDLINSKKIRLSLGSVNIRTGNSHYFDNVETNIGPDHVMASGALPPAFPPVLIDGEAYWDGGILSNTPLQHVLDVREKSCNLLVFQVDLFNARGMVPVNFEEVLKRQKDILYSSRTRYSSNTVTEMVNTRKAINDLLAKLPPDLLDDPEVQHLAELTQVAPVDLVHLIYRPGPADLESKDYEFSRVSVRERWQAGKRDVHDVLTHPEWLKMAGSKAGATQYDLAHHSRAVHESETLAPPPKKPGDSAQHAIGF